MKEYLNITPKIEAKLALKSDLLEDAAACLGNRIIFEKVGLPFDIMRFNDKSTSQILNFIPSAREVISDINFYKNLQLDDEVSIDGKGNIKDIFYNTLKQISERKLNELDPDKLLLAQHVVITLGMLHYYKSVNYDTIGVNVRGVSNLPDKSYWRDNLSGSGTDSVLCELEKTTHNMLTSLERLDYEKELRAAHFFAASFCYLAKFGFKRIDANPNSFSRQ